MAKYISMENIKFVLHEVLDVEQVCKFPRYSDFDKSSFDILLDSLKEYSDKVLYPCYGEMDEQPARYEDGKIIVHPAVKQLMDDAGDIGMIGHTFDYEHGGMQMPHVIATALGHVAECANNHLTGYTGLTHGSAELIVAFGSDELRETYVITAGDYQKMGQKGYCTTHLVFGEHDNSVGWLVGEPNRGLKYMFQMMNAARIDVGYTAASTATAAYYASLQYAKERPQGRRILSGGQKNVEAEQTTIINHPDVRRMLLSQRAITEGSIALLAQASFYHDLSLAGPEENREKYHNLLELMTPMAKTYPSEKGRESINNGLQILGGYGFCSEFLLQQYLRDIRIMSIYEGTTGIQSLDLLGRKVIMKNGEVMKQWTREVIDTIKAASNYDNLRPYADQLKDASKKLESTLMHLLQFAMSGDHERYVSDATIFMEMMSTIAIAWQWLKMATAAKTALVTGNMTYNEEFYESKIYTMRFFYKYELTNIESCIVKLKHAEVLTVKEEVEKVFA